MSLVRRRLGENPSLKHQIGGTASPERGGSIVSDSTRLAVIKPKAQPRARARLPFAKELRPAAV